MKIFRGALKIFRHLKGGSEKIRGGGLQKFVYFKTNRRGGTPIKIELLVRGATKISCFEF